MKKILYILVITLLFSSCVTTHFFSTISTSDIKLKKSESGDFIFENDTIRITYSFHGQNAPVYLNVHNKTNEPLYVDWQRSAIITDNVATSYLKNETTITGDIQGSSYRHDNDYSSISGSFWGSASLPKYVSFIPPQSGIKHSSIGLTQANFNYKTISDNKEIDSRMEKVTKIRKDNTVRSAQTIDFDENESPLKFRSYLSLYMGEKMQPITIDVSFYMSNVLKSKGISPSSMANTDFNRGDLFYVEKVNTTGATIAGVAVLGGLIVGGVAASDNNNSESSIE